MQSLLACQLWLFKCGTWQNEPFDFSNLEATEDFGKPLIERIKAMCWSPTKQQALGATTKKQKIASGFEVLKLQGLTILSHTAGLGDGVEPRAVSFKHVDKVSLILGAPKCRHEFLIQWQRLCLGLGDALLPSELCVRYFLNWDVDPYWPGRTAEAASFRTKNKLIHETLWPLKLQTIRRTRIAVGWSKLLW